MWQVKYDQLYWQTTRNNHVIKAENAINNRSIIGAKWQIAPEVELVAVYHRMKRSNVVTGNKTNRLDYDNFEADALRVQLQYKFQVLIK
jgi:hypothetical protein